MRKNLYALRLYAMSLCTALFFGAGLHAQQLNIKDFFIYGTRSVSIGSSVTLTGGGRIGSNLQISSSSGGTLGTGLHSGGTIALPNSAVISGPVTAANSGNAATGFTAGSSTSITDNVLVVRNAMISSGTVGGAVRTTGTYTGPTPAGGLFQNQTVAQLGLPTLPTLPALSNLTCTSSNAGATNLTPGNRYGNIKGKSLTIRFNGPGIYEINSFDLSQTNAFVFDFAGNTSGRFYIRVRNNMSLGKVSASFVNLPNGTNVMAAARIFTEVQGTGTAFECDNGSSQSATRWLGTVFAPNGAINIGAGTGNTEFIGALWSGRGAAFVSNTYATVILNSGVNARFVPFQATADCTGSSVSILAVEGSAPTMVNGKLTAALP